MMPPTEAPQAPEPKTKEPGPGLWLSIIILTLGTVGVTWGGYAAFQSAFELLSTESFETPGSQTRSLDPGEYQIFTREASVNIFDTAVDFDDVVVTLDQVTVVNADTGGPVAIDPLFTAEPLGRSANVYEGTAVFKVTQSGRYTVTIASTGESRAVFGRTIESSLDRIVPWLIMGGVGLVLFLLGVIMLIVGMVRRKRHRDRQTLSAAPALTGFGGPPPIPAAHRDLATTTAPPAPPPPTPAAPSAPTPSTATSPAEPTPTRPTPPAPNTRQSESETPW